MRVVPRVLIVLLVLSIRPSHQLSAHRPTRPVRNGNVKTSSLFASSPARHDAKHKPRYVMRPHGNPHVDETTLRSSIATPLARIDIS
jgi:hypothetical protein